MGKCFFLALALGLPLPLLAQSQAAGGAIEGTVFDESGAVIPGVSIAIRNEATGVVRETATDAGGSFRAPLLPVGRYELSASRSGFATLKHPGLLLSIGQTLTLSLVLKLAGAVDTVVVTAEAPGLEVSRSHQASIVGERAIGTLPTNGRNFIDFVLTTPGVNRDTRAGDISFGGLRGTLNSFVIDGADDNNTVFGQTLGRAGSGRAPYQFSQDAVLEFQVNRNAYSAEYGRAGGAVINAVTKSGGNEYHGSAFEFFRNEALNANSYANKVAGISDRSPFRINQFGGSLSGPIVRNTAFFLGSYDRQRQTIPNPVTLVLPANLPRDQDTQEGLATVVSKAHDYERTQNQDVFLAKLDWQIGTRHRLSVRYNHQSFTGGNREAVGPTNAEEHSGDSLVRTRIVNASLASVFSSTLFNELRAQYARDQEPGEANTNDPEVVVNQSGQRVLAFGRNNYSPREYTIERVQVADTVTWAKGAHSFKLGADFIHDDILNFFPGFFAGSYTFNSLGSFNRGVPNGSGEFFQQNFAGPGTSGAETKPNSTEVAAFVQDVWKLRRTVTLSLGLRYDVQSFAKPSVRNPDPQLQAAGIDTSVLNTDTNNIGPRLGLAWNVSDKTVVRAGYGIFYGRTPAIIVGTAHSNNGVNVISVLLTGGQAPTYPTVLDSPPSGVAGVRPSIFFFDPDYQNPEVHQASGGIERAISEDLSVSASYQFVAGRKLQRSRDFNVGTPVPTEVPIAGGGFLTVQRFPSVRPFSDFDRIIRFESSAESNYNGLSLEVRKRSGGRLQGGLVYTLGHVTDTKPDATAAVPGIPGDDVKHASNPVDFEVDRADGDVDVRHRLVLNGIWDLTYWKGSGGLTKALLADWAVSWIGTLQSGQPYSKRVLNDLNNDGNRSNDIVPGSRNSYRLETSYTIDMRLSKRIPLGQRVRLEMIAEAFNLLNTTNVTARRDTFYNFTNGVLVPQSNLSNPRLNFGADLSTQVTFEDTQRIVQLATKITF
jgi:hypothetical protein